MKTALLMCTYNRINNLNITLDCIKKQTFKNFDFFIINNNKNIKNNIIKIVEESKLNNIKIIDSIEDTSPFSRFFFAYKLSKIGYDNFIIIDDDQVIENKFIEKCLNQVEDNVFKSWWSYKTNYNYLDRKRLKNDELGNYAGPGGSVFTKSIFLIDNILNCPKEFRSMDDIWISYNIIKNNFTIKTLKVDIGFIPDLIDVSLFSKDKDNKEKFWKEINILLTKGL